MLRSIALLGVDRLAPVDDSGEPGPVSPLNGFLAGVLLPFDPAAAAGLTTTCRVDIDGRRFEFSVDHGHLAAARAEPAVTITASAADLYTSRFGPTDAKRKAALRRIDFDGEQRDIDALRTALSL